MGDWSLKVGETALFILTGERLKLHQYLHLEQMATDVASAPGGEEPLDFRQIWGGISGARVGRLVGREGPLIWKEGAEAKIEEEVREMEEWNRLLPRPVPRAKKSFPRGRREAFLGP